MQNCKAKFIHTSKGRCQVHFRSSFDIIRVVDCPLEVLFDDSKGMLWPHIRYGIGALFILFNSLFLYSLTGFVKTFENKQGLKYLKIKSDFWEKLKKFNTPTQFFEALFPRFQFSALFIPTNIAYSSFSGKCPCINDIWFLST